MKKNNPTSDKSISMVVSVMHINEFMEHSCLKESKGGHQVYDQQVSSRMSIFCCAILDTILKHLLPDKPQGKMFRLWVTWMVWSRNTQAQFLQCNHLFCSLMCDLLEDFSMKNLNLVSIIFKKGLLDLTLITPPNF